jgi:large subunit ribosomal protein L6
LQRQPMSTVQIKGPLGALFHFRSSRPRNNSIAGEMSMEIPPYITIDRKTPDSPAVLQVQDAEVRKQREMWGTYFSRHPAFIPQIS